MFNGFGIEFCRSKFCWSQRLNSRHQLTDCTLLNLYCGGQLSNKRHSLLLELTTFCHDVKCLSPFHFLLVQSKGASKSYINEGTQIYRAQPTHPTRSSPLSHKTPQRATCNLQQEGRTVSIRYTESLKLPKSGTVTQTQDR
jgi:hypothetical protein